ncbi:hypothetical protein ED733_008851 [Metarhizium rileyi]|uniref:Cell wall galactomannoprotein n=1 Tax=Metarhizium rileyi (strain RCEF 4871) TaxID=1649241 RepID=A0A5C6GNN7_METRR|nr:hypothetical protein ED733_008851 [Metarhizium rileyi]
MKFITTVTVALAGTAFAAPYKRSILTDVTNVLSDVNVNNTVVHQLESQLHSVFQDLLPQVEKALGGIPLANKLLELVRSGLKPVAIQAIGQALAMVQSGLPINAVNSFLNEVTNGTVTNLENTLGANDLVGSLTSVTDLVSGIVVSL